MSDDQQPNPRGGARENMLALVLSGIVLGAFAVFLIVVSGALLLQIAGVLLAGGVLAWIHYQLWGRRLTEQTAGEREEAELRAKLEKDEWEERGPGGRKNE